MPVPNPVAFTIFNLDIRWYGILIATGMMLGCWIAIKRAPSMGVDPDKLFNMLIVAIPCAVIGARAYYVIFEWPNYAGNFLKMINIREGGLAIHGGLIGAFLAAFVLTKLWKMGTLNTFDLAVPSIALGQAIGRWGNYFNSEAHGGPTDLPWAVNINGVGCHPTFLYESIWCFLLFIFLIYMSGRRQFPGQIFCLYGILYSIERFFVEALRTDSLMIGPLKQAQVFSITIIIVCLVLYLVFSRRAAAVDNK